MRLTLAVSALALVAGCSSQPRSGAEGAGSPASPGARGQARAQELVLHALRFVGVPYRYGGDSPETGFDCSGLVWRVYQQAAGIALPRDTQGISRIGFEIAREELLPGDLVFFNTLRRPYSHVGIYLGEQRFIHAPSEGGVVGIARMSERYWRQRFDGARRVSF